MNIQVKPLNVFSTSILVITLIVVGVMLPLMYRQRDMFIEMAMEDLQYEVERIVEQASLYARSNGTVPDMSDLEAEGFRLEPGTAVQWKITLYWPDSLAAVSTERMPGGSGKRVTYHIQENLYYGYQQASIGSLPVID